MEIEVLRPRELSPARLARWAQLQASDPALDSPFLSPGWARAVERAQEGRGHAIRVAVVHAHGRDIAFLPVRAGQFTAMPAGAPMCDRQGLVAEPGHIPDLRGLVRALGVQRFDFSALGPGQPAFAPHIRGQDPVRVVEVAEGYAAYEAERRQAGTGVLKDCDKKRRKVERELGPARFTPHAADPADFEALLAWKSAQFQATGQPDVLAAPWTRRLVRDLLQTKAADFGAILFTLHFGERLAAVHLHLHGRHTLHGWLIAHDAAFERYSPGLLLFQDILRWMDGARFDRLDLGPGEYRFKRELANATETTGHGFVGVASPAVLVRHAAYGLRAAAEALPLGAASDLPGKAMRRWDVMRGLR